MIEMPEDVAEIAQRVYGDITAEELLDTVAPIYARHISQEHLAELTRFSESWIGVKFYRLFFTQSFDDKAHMANVEMMSHFNADEIIAIMRFAQSDAFIASKQAEPAIESDLTDALHQFFKAKLREYLER